MKNIFVAAERFEIEAFACLGNGERERGFRKKKWHFEMVKQENEQKLFIKVSSFGLLLF
jgi:hypothetical protein